MTYKKNGFSHLFKFFKLPVTFRLKKDISYGKCFIYDQNFRFDINSYRKSQSHKHTTGIRFYRLVYKISDICKIQDILQFCIDLFFAKSDHLTVQIHVFDTGILSVESGSQFQQRGDSSIHHHFSLCGIQYAGDNFQNRGFTGTIRSDNSHGLPLFHLKTYVVQSIMFFISFFSCQSEGFF